MADVRPHYFQSVPGWCDYDDYYATLVAALPSGARVVEVGGWKGQSAACMGIEIANSGKAIRYDVVDTWEGSDEPIHQADLDVVAGTLYDAFLRHIEPIREYVTPVRMASVEAAATYADASLDAVFLDGAHDTDSVIADCQAWWPKVKPGGVLAGHDANWESVQRGVHAVCQWAGVRVRPVSRSSWEIRKPEVITDWTVPEERRAVLIAICSNERSIYRQTVESLLSCLAGPQVAEVIARHGFQDYEIEWVSKYPSVAALRDYALMKAQLMEASHVLFLDADMTWPKNVLDLMLRHHSRGMVSGVYYLKAWPYWPVVLERGFINCEPRRVKDEDGELQLLPPSYATEYHYAIGMEERGTLREVDLIGMGCALVPVALTHAWKRPWFEYMPDHTGLPSVTEDVAFCARARAVGCPILVDTDVQCGHIGQQEIKAAWYQRAMIEREMLARAKADAAAEAELVADLRSDGSAA